MSRKPIAVMFTDLHVEDDTAEVCVDIANQAAILAKELNVNVVINGGDTFNSRKSQSLNSIISVKMILDNYHRNGIQMYAIDGNHDKLMYNSKNSYMDAFENHPALHLVKTTEFGVYTKGNVRISMSSFFSDDNQCTSNRMFIDYQNSLNSQVGKSKKVNPDIFNILITHNGFDGARSNGGHNIESDITTKCVNNFDKILVGHYHDPSMIGKQLYYTGSCRQAWFTENKHKGFTVIYDDGYTEMMMSIQKSYTELEAALKGDDDVKTIDKTVKLLETKFKDDYKRIHIIGSKSAIKSIDIPSIKARGIDVRTTDTADTVHEQSGVQEEFKYVSFDVESVAGLFMEFCDEEGLDDKSVEYGYEVLGRTISKFKQN